MAWPSVHGVVREHDSEFSDTRGKMLLVGLTGGIATGKSTASAVFRECGVPVIDADLIARKVVEPGQPAWRLVRDEFGAEYFDDENGGTLRREALGQLVFNDPQARRRLNAITHPAIRRETLRQLIAHLFSGARYVVLDTPLLFEVGYDRFLQRVIVVDCPDHVQLQRLMSRDMLSETDARKRIAAQMPMSEKRRRATDLVDNSGSREATVAQVRHLIEQLNQSWMPWMFRAVVVAVILCVGWLVSMIFV